MECPYCQSSSVTERPETTSWGYRGRRCRTCVRGFNERTGSVFNRVQYPPDVICLVVLWRVRYKLSLRDLAEMFLERGVAFTHEAVREWETKLAPVLSEMLRKQQREGGTELVLRRNLSQSEGARSLPAAGRTSHDVDATMLSDAGSEATVEAFFDAPEPSPAGCLLAARPMGIALTPEPSSQNWERPWIHRTNRYLNNHLEQDHRGIKQRTRADGWL